MALDVSIEAAEICSARTGTDVTYGGHTDDDLELVPNTFLERAVLVRRVLAQRRSEKLTLQEVAWTTATRGRACDT